MCTGGAESLLIDIINEQIKSNEVSLFIINDIYDQNITNRIDPKVDIVKIHRKPKSKNPFPILKLNWLLIIKNFDVVHCHNSSMPKLLIGRFYKSKIIYTVHDVNLKISGSNRIKRAIAISKAVEEDVSSRYSFPISIVYNGIRYKDIKKKNKWNHFDEFKIVNVARLVHETKGQDLLIRAVAILKQKGINVSVDFIGDGESLKFLKNLSEELGVSGNINFLGNKDRNFIYHNLCKYNLLCHPARYEGFGLTVVEGMAAKLPVLVSDDGGPFEIIGFGKFGYYFKNNDATDCAKMIEYIINNPDDVKEKVEPAYLEVKDKYSIESLCKRYDLVYNS